MSDPGLSKALRRLLSDGIVGRDEEGLYSVNPKLRSHLGGLLRPLHSEYLLERMVLIAGHLKRFDRIVSLVVFGSAAQGKAGYDSDVDLLVVVRERGEALEERIHGAISNLVLKTGIPI